MTRRLVRVGAILGALVTSACALPAALTTMGAVTGGVTGVYMAWHQANEDLSRAIIQGCLIWERKKAAAQTRVSDGVAPAGAGKKVETIALWADAACNPNNPPPGDPLATTVWLIGLADQVQMISETSK